ncbi:hypothetical protein CB0940_09364 [Cercospora beticola]|uniref:F-box domain-containing protein n=1 Tax=Cercospora beticola TaxID=122368 RepID=A0A2G5HH61_CERBT|nr:hypothetical protein CB0940_09364 [Cercospora beticola]PIA91572.1 hypothetical protein CB0940_09364 [Cercospora beticola]WPB06321.1 hypothetical protein RHO25_010978 [Cercospora beticola]CAK1366212.1 unnamed protein product [Cercospora beticola]
MAAVARCSLLGLPTEIRLHIYQLLFASLEVRVQRGPERLHSDVRYETSSDDNDDDDREEEYDAEQVEEQDRPGRFVDTDGRNAEVSWRDWTATSDRNVATSRGLSLLPGLPLEVRALRCVCKQISSEIDDSWHSAVTYHFASTVAFVDVLSQWADEKLRALRHIYVVDTPLPVYAFAKPDFYVTHNFNEALSLFPGLQLDSLTVENVWLLPGGKPRDAWCASATTGTLKRLLTTDGWRTLRYMSGILPLSPTQMKQLDMAIETYCIEKQEPDFRYGLGRVRPQPYSSHNILIPGEPPEDENVTKELVEQWYKEHPEEVPLREEDHYLDDVKELHLAMWAQRGANSTFTQDGSAISSTLESLKSNISWVELRQTDDYLVDDGVEDPASHL